jgi:hypothetical protein
VSCFGDCAPAADQVRRKLAMFTNLIHSGHRVQ